MTKRINDRQLALLRGISTGRARRSGGYVKVGDERFSFATLQRLLDEGFIEFDWRGWRIAETGRAYLAELSGGDA
ncbi:MAG: hypothetical protein KDJ44_21640 [Rhodoblastus sp.]|nr:hypothetical protein [Rhodoblastus sp.]